MKLRSLIYPVPLVWILPLVSYPRTLPRPRSQSFPPVFSNRSSIGLILTFRSFRGCVPRRWHAANSLAGLVLAARAPRPSLHDRLGSSCFLTNLRTSRFLKKCWLLSAGNGSSRPLSGRQDPRCCWTGRRLPASSVDQTRKHGMQPRGSSPAALPPGSD